MTTRTKENLKEVGKHSVSASIILTVLIGYLEWRTASAQTNVQAARDVVASEVQKLNSEDEKIAAKLESESALLRQEINHIKDGQAEIKRLVEVLQKKLDTQNEQVVSLLLQIRNSGNAP